MPRLSEKLVRETCLGTAAKLAIAAKKRKKPMTAVEADSFHALIDAAECLLREEFPRDVDAFLKVIDSRSR